MFSCWLTNPRRFNFSSSSLLPRRWFHMWHSFYCLFLVSSSVGVPGRLCFVIMAFPGHLHLREQFNWAFEITLIPQIFDVFHFEVMLVNCRPRWLNWMRHPTEDQEVAGSTPAEVGNIFSWRLIIKYFQRSFSPFRWFKKGSCQFLVKEYAQYWLTA